MQVQSIGEIDFPPCHRPLAAMMLTSGEILYPLFTLPDSLNMGQESLEQFFFSNTPEIVSVHHLDILKFSIPGDDGDFPVDFVQVEVLLQYWLYWANRQHPLAVQLVDKIMNGLLLPRTLSQFAKTYPNPQHIYN